PVLVHGPPEPVGGQNPTRPDRARWLRRLMWIDNKEPPRAEKKCHPLLAAEAPSDDAPGRSVRPRLRPGRRRAPQRRGARPPAPRSATGVLGRGGAHDRAGAPRAGAAERARVPGRGAARLGPVLPRAAGPERVQPAGALVVGRVRIAPASGAARRAS